MLRWFAFFSVVFIQALQGVAQTPAFASPVVAGVVESFEIREASGLVASRQNPGVLWTHNDSGSAGTVFAISTNGALLTRYTILNVFFGDFEDIAIGPGPTPEHDYIYLGDIGDNFSSRTSIRVLRFPEPAVYGYLAENSRYEQVVDAREIEMTYPDGPFDAETLMVDPITGDLFIATKLVDSSRIYRATRAELDGGGPIELTFIREISFFKPSAGDISSDGRLILLRRGGKGGAWQRQLTQSVGDALAANPSNIPLANEANGEAIAIHPTGLGYYTLGEGVTQTNFYYRRTDSGVPRQPLVFIKPGDVWSYDDSGLAPDPAWKQLSFVDTDWSSGAAQLGYGQGDERTQISYGIDDFDKNPTTYFRKTFTKATAPAITNLTLRICFNDGAAVYLNGTEVFRRNLAVSANHTNLALASGSERQNYWVSIPVNVALLRTGTNVVAVELHRFEPTGPDLSFDLQLGDWFVDRPIRFTSNPQLVGGQWRISLAGPRGSLCIVDGSTDLQSWSEAGRTVLTNGVGIFQEPATFQPTGRFYRVH